MFCNQDSIFHRSKKRITSMKFTDVFYEALKQKQYIYFFYKNEQKLFLDISSKTYYFFITFRAIKRT